jgi:PAS domain S-box-containing protein
VLLSFTGSVALAGGSEKTRTVVVLYPDADDGRPGTALVDHGIRSTFAAGAQEKIEVHSEHLDLPRFPDPDYQQRLAEFLRRKYTDRKIDLVIAVLATGLDFALNYREQAFPGVPIVYGVVDQREIDARKLPADVIGVPIKMDLAATLDVALRLHPSTERVYVVTGKSKFDVEWKAEARRVFQAYEDKLAFIPLAGLPMPELSRRVAELPANSIVYYVHVLEDGDGKILVPSEALKQIAAKANAPVYGHVDTYVSRGIVGGRVFSFEAAGQNAAALGLKILAGERPEKIAGIGAGGNSYMFDWRQLQRWGISETSLPPGSIVRHHEPGFWDLYRWHILGVISICIVEALLIIGLLVQRSSRNRAEKFLRESESRFRLMADTAPVMVWMSGPDKRCTYFNKTWLDFTGRPLERELGDGWSEGVHAEDLRRCLETYARAFEARQEFRMEYRLRRADGVYRWIFDTGVPRFDSDGAFEGYIGSCLDVTDQKQAMDALRQSQAELRELTGKLLLTQETERRRIARELHDDLSQGLAFLSVELDMLRQNISESESDLSTTTGQAAVPATPRTAAPMGERIQRLSAQLKQLSSTVHELSHQLHPAKLEQLGLVAAVRGLCKELSQNHGLPIDFKYHEMPQRLPEDTALCLYRIVQESLQNVIKHSAARHAIVELNGDADTICLRVVDDGNGFDPASLDGNEGLGLISMRERLNLVRGRITIDSKVGAGARIEVAIPLTSPGA